MTRRFCFAVSALALLLGTAALACEKHDLKNPGQSKPVQTELKQFGHLPHATPRPSPTPEPPRYTLMVDVVNQITRAYTYDETGEYNILVREMICSTGTAQYPTPCGTTIMPKKPQSL